MNVLVFDNRGRSFDRYTVFYLSESDPITLETPYVVMSHNPGHPQGVCLHDILPGYPDEFCEYDESFGWQIEFDELPPACQGRVKRDLQMEVEA